ncbi:HAMP domain-containing sensor histidine kinase [Paenibacillus chibensis]|uniref:HAMP domain-containing sensor histidine kinase n=1 Tax=Paenibacillus chibensis TaxID=59846 RepID=UPI000FD7BB3E|nr:HAMP domain-containing sensor histidine kinase [Paenibacillus chibensis]MEC0370678.1 HAMP domain-containing sensor histidine kinase [Paenibacillus chibensis]
MRMKWVVLTVLFICMAGMFLSLRAIGLKVNTNVDLAAVNEVVKITESHWGRLEQENYNGNPLQFVVLDHQGVVRYQSAEGLPTTLNDALKNRDTVTDVLIQGAPAGKIIVHYDDEAVIEQSKKRLVLVMTGIFAALTVFCTLYLVFLNHAFFKPFRKLQSFAVHIARGNFDVPLKMDKNNPFGAFTESFDIMREELAAARQSEYEANRSKKELVASLSHDIKTPVASIKAVSELMLVRASDDKVIKQLNMIYAKAEQIDLLVTDMFHATLEELQELKVSVTEELSGVLHDIISNVNFDDQIRCEPIPPCLIVTDAARLQQVFDNILSNSYKYAGTPVTITSRLSEDYLVLDIMDDGPGIGEDELPLLFHKFYRGHNAEGQSGTGLGLFISKYFMQKMLGDIQCHNRENGFTVTLCIKLA